MTISQNLMMAILSLDSYNEGYAPQIAVQAHSFNGLGGQLGDATIVTDSSQTINPDSTAAAGFYAIEYKLGGQKVISFRGTDNYTTSTNNSGELTVTVY